MPTDGPGMCSQDGTRPPSAAAAAAAPIGGVVNAPAYSRARACRRAEQASRVASMVQLHWMADIRSQVARSPICVRVRCQEGERVCAFLLGSTTELDARDGLKVEIKGAWGWCCLVNAALPLCNPAGTNQTAWQPSLAPLVSMSLPHLP